METLSWTDIRDLFGFAILAALVAGAICPLVGCFLLVRRTGFYGIALPQFAAAGVAFGFALGAWWGGALGLIGIDEATLTSGTHTALNYHLFWALLFTFGGLAGLVLVGRSRGTEAGRVAAAFAIASALTVLFAHASAAGDIYVHDLLRGEILAIGLHEFDTLASVLGLTLLLIVLFHRDLVLVSYDHEMGRVLGKPIVAFELLMQGITGAAVATSVMTVGPIVLFGLLVIPPLAARGLARSMLSFFFLSSVLGVISAAFGVGVSFHFDWPLGPAVVVVAAAELLLVWLWGLIRRAGRR